MFFLSISVTCSTILLIRSGLDLARRYILKIPQLIVILFFLIVISFLGAPVSGAGSVDGVLGASLGQGGLSIGMSKARVVDKYGEPDMKTFVTSPEWNEAREEWFYRARMDILPVNAGYLSDNLYLYFDGDNLTNISKKPLGKAEEAEVEGGRRGI